MLTQTDLERERYEARRKAQLDYNTGLKVARMEGLEQGIEQGIEKGLEQGRAEARLALIQTIHFCDRLRHQPETPTEQLASLPFEELARLAQDLQKQVLEQARVE